MVKKWRFLSDTIVAIKGKRRKKVGVILLRGARKHLEWAWKAQGWSSQAYLVSQVRIQRPVHLQRGL